MLDTVALSPVYLRKEQDHGSWLGLNGCTAVFANQKAVFMLYATEQAPDGMRERYASLVPQLIIRSHLFGQGLARDVLIWTVMPLANHCDGLEVLTRRLASAIANWHHEPQRSFRDHPRMRGLLVLAPQAHDAPLKTAAHGDAIGIALPLVGPGFIDGLQAIADAIERVQVS
jgi:hypothetical protein